MENSKNNENLISTTVLENNKKITSRLDTIIVLLLAVLKDKDTFPKLSAIFFQLKKIGLSNEEIAIIFDKTSSQVAKLSYEFKRPLKNNSKEKNNG